MMVWLLDHQICVFVGGKFDCFMFCFSIAILIFISLTKIVLEFSKTGCYIFSCEFQMPMGGWTKWNSKSKLVQDLESMMCSGLLDGKSALEIQMEHPAHQIFSPTNFPNNISRLQSKLGLESGATVTFLSPQVVPSHSPPPSFVQAHPCLESQAMQPLHDPCSSSLPMVTVRSKQCQHGNVSLGTHDDCFHLSGHL